MKRTFAFLVLPEIHLMDLAGPDQTILEAIDYGAQLEIRYAGLGDAPMTTAGLQLGSTEPYRNLNLKAGDFLVIPGSKVEYILSEEFRKQEDLFQWIREQYEKGVQLVTICAGAFVLGLCGLLTNRRCTTHFKRTSQLQQVFPKAQVQENLLFVEDNGIFTSAGIASGIDLTLHLLEREYGSYFTHKVARELVIYNRRDGHHQQQSVLLQFRNHIHSGIHKVQDVIIEHIDKKYGLAELAEIACMSERNFTRIFRKETGISVHQFVHSIRKEVALNLSKNPDLSPRQIANKIGLNSERQLQRILAE